MLARLGRRVDLRRRSAAVPALRGGGRALRASRRPRWSRSRRPDDGRRRRIRGRAGARGSLRAARRAPTQVRPGIGAWCSTCSPTLARAGRPGRRGRGRRPRPVLPAAARTRRGAPQARPRGARSTAAGCTWSSSPEALPQRRRAPRCAARRPSRLLEAAARARARLRVAGALVAGIPLPLVSPGDPGARTPSARCLAARGRSRGLYPHAQVALADLLGRSACSEAPPPREPLFVLCELAGQERRRCAPRAVLGVHRRASLPAEGRRRVREPQGMLRAALSSWTCSACFLEAPRSLLSCTA